MLSMPFRKGSCRSTKLAEETSGTCGMHLGIFSYQVSSHFIQAEITGHEARVKKVCSDGEAMVMQGKDFRFKNKHVYILLIYRSLS